MFIVHETSPSGCSNRVLHITASDRLSHDDHDRLLLQMEASTRESGADRCWIDMNAFQGIEPGVLAEDVQDDCQCFEIRRCAIVGERAWSLCMCRFAHAVFPVAAVRYFEPGGEDEARDWLAEPEVVPSRTESSTSTSSPVLTTV